MLFFVVAVKSQANVLKKDLEAVKTKYNEVSEKLMEKTRQYQKLQVLYMDYPCIVQRTSHFSLPPMLPPSLPSLPPPSLPPPSPLPLPSLPLFPSHPGNVRHTQKVRPHSKHPTPPVSHSLSRRNINPSSLDSEGDKGSPRVHRHTLKPHPFEIPLGSLADRNGDQSWNSDVLCDISMVQDHYLITSRDTRLQVLWKRIVTSLTL